MKSAYDIRREHDAARRADRTEAFEKESHFRMFYATIACAILAVISPILWDVIKSKLFRSDSPSVIPIEEYVPANVVSSERVFESKAFTLDKGFHEQQK
jgi:hypothetical protein